MIKPALRLVGGADLKLSLFERKGGKSMKAMLGCCGLDCEKCGAYLATINNDDEMRKQTAKLWSEWNNTTIPPEASNCTGCRSHGVQAYYCENLCEIRSCALGKGFKTCAECAELSGCRTVRTIHDNSDEAADNLQLLSDTCGTA